MEQLLNYIAGDLHPPAGNKYIDNYEPATGIVYSKIPDSGPEDVERAVTAARKAFKEWSVMPAATRSEILIRISDLIDERAEELAQAESKDNGKPVKLARTVDIPRASSNIRFFATAILHNSSEFHDTDGKAINYTLRQPVGIAGCISPWNLPLYLFTWKIAPALAAGNCVIAKPSEITPYTAFLFSKICIDAGLPPGVLNIIHGYGHSAGAAIVSHPGIGIISFTGGTQTGKAIAAVAAPMFKKMSLELGGKNANIIFGDTDIEKAVRLSLLSSFSNQGQICLCGSRILVERNIYDQFRDRFVEETKKLKTGDPLDEGTNIGALVSKQHLDKVLSYVGLARNEGGRLLCGGEIVKTQGRTEGGYFMSPAVIEGLSEDCRTNQEEIFGPVVTLIPFDGEEEALCIANCTPYGLAAVIQTNDVSRAHRLASGLHAGIIWINTWLLRDLRTPFGGMKQSGVGREGGYEALRFFTESKNVCIKI